ncbi:hypothetical protein ALC62_03926 [Cyphomyrmex costatus]|uniref:Uncharacterized protein n=1 Tax=Cyphomyrmex costatus TaxID=456900 RepID=A0A195CWS7_9HYME|nr:hypothetical protein ALC62_03926 [Cyphomyrmex costatus]
MFREHVINRRDKNKARTLRVREREKRRRVVVVFYRVFVCRSCILRLVTDIRGILPRDERAFEAHRTCQEKCLSARPRF